MYFDCPPVALVVEGAAKFFTGGFTHMSIDEGLRQTIEVMREIASQLAVLNGGLGLVSLSGGGSSTSARDPGRPLAVSVFPMDHLHTRESAAAFARIDPHTISAWKRAGRITYFSDNPVRIRHSDLLRAIENGVPRANRASASDALTNKLLQKLK